MAHTAIICRRDAALTVYIDFTQASSPVYYTYDHGQGDGPERQSTPFQGADMPRNEQQAANIVNEWLEEMG